MCCQELAKIHGGTRNPPAASNASQPAQSTQPLVILEATSPTPLTEGGEPSLNILSAPPVRKVSRFQVSVVNEGEEVAGAATLGEESTAAGQEDFDSANQEFCGEDQEDRSSPPNFPCEGITRRGRFSVVTHPGDLADAYDMFQLPTDDEDEDRPYDLNQRSPALRHHPSSLYHLPSDYAVKRKTPRPPLKLLPSTGSFYNHHSPVTSPTSTYGMSQFTADDMQRCLYSQSVDEPHDKPRHLQRQRRATENSHWIEPPAFTLSPPHTETGGLLPRAGSVADFRNLQPSSACPSRSTSPLMSPSNASNTLQRWASHSDLSAPVKSSSTRRKLPLRPDQKCTLVRSYSFDPPHLRSTESSTSRRHLSSSDEPRHLLQARLKSARSMINLVQNKQMTHHYPQLHHRKSVYHTVHAGMKPSVWVQQPKSSCSSSLEDLSDEDADDEDDTAAAAARYQQSSRAAQRLMIYLPWPLAWLAEIIVRLLHIPLLDMWDSSLPPIQAGQTAPNAAHSAQQQQQQDSASDGETETELNLDEELQRMMHRFCYQHQIPVPMDMHSYVGTSTTAAAAPLQPPPANYYPPALHPPGSRLLPSIDDQVHGIHSGLLQPSNMGILPAQQQPPPAAYMAAPPTPTFISAAGYYYHPSPHPMLPLQIPPSGIRMMPSPFLYGPHPSHTQWGSPVPPRSPDHQC
ncbi:hypothetical protein B566_EDAN006981 [Ephemera danica]|nr:hypothetical protein B566_EDAN006981 [Ephemera danica]